jgi:hypothetical protein
MGLTAAATTRGPPLSRRTTATVRGHTHVKLSVFMYFFQKYADKQVRGKW